MSSRLAVHPEDLPRFLKVVLDNGQELPHLMAGHRVALAVPAVALETAHSSWQEGVGVRATCVWIWVSGVLIPRCQRYGLHGLLLRMDNVVLVYRGVSDRLHRLRFAVCVVWSLPQLCSALLAFDVCCRAPKYRFLIKYRIKCLVRRYFLLYSKGVAG